MSPNHQNSFGDVPFSNLEQKRRRNKFQVLLWVHKRIMISLYWIQHTKKNLKLTSQFCTLKNCRFAKESLILICYFTRAPILWLNGFHSYIAQGIALPKLTAKYDRTSLNSLKWGTFILQIYRKSFLTLWERIAYITPILRSVTQIYSGKTDQENVLNNHLNERKYCLSMQEKQYLLIKPYCEKDFWHINRTH